jgi:hypothetical protein
MSSGGYIAILEKKLGRKVKENTQSADVAVAIKAKGLALEATFDVAARGTGGLGDKESDTIFKAASARIDEVLEDIIMGQTFFDKINKKVSITSKGKVKIPDKVRGLTDKRNRAMSGLSLSRILNLTLSRHIENLMGTGNRLVHRTGRLANSAQVQGLRFKEKVDRQRKNRVSVFFNYMIAPYAVFEPSGKQHKPGRSPSKLIREALNSAMRETLSKQSFKNNTFDYMYDGSKFK